MNWYDQLLRAKRNGLRGGIEHSVLQHPSKMQDFTAKCHRGFERSQSDIIDLIEQSSSMEDPIFHELVARKIADAIAFTMVGTKFHLVKRMCFLPDIPQVQLQEVKQYASVASKLNAESRQTFALINDLTTFIHIGDILRVDFRDGPAKLSIRELKTGEVNQKLSEIVSKYPKVMEAVDKLAFEEVALSKKEVQQAKRMLKQRIRMQQVADAAKYDKGIDVKFQVPMRHSIKEYAPSRISEEDIGLIAEQAVRNGAAAYSTDFCIHIGAGFDDSPETALQSAKNSAHYAFCSTSDKFNELTEIRNELSTQVKTDDLTFGVHLIDFNLHSFPCEPWVLWPFTDEQFILIAKRKLRFILMFDLPGFFFLARKMGYSVRLSSTKEGSILQQKFGGSEIKTWDNRLVLVDEKPIGGGIFSRILASLYSPSGMLQAITDARKDLDDD